MELKSGKAKKRILLVDDDPDILELLSSRIKSWGLGVLTAENGEECVRVARAEKPDLIFLDIVMPVMNGREACTVLKSDPQTSQIPVVFLTALAMPEHIEAGFRCGGAGYIVKPFKGGEIKDQIAQCLNR